MQFVEVFSVGLKKSLVEPAFAAMKGFCCYIFETTFRHPTSLILAFLFWAVPPLPDIISLSTSSNGSYYCSDEFEEEATGDFERRHLVGFLAGDSEAKYTIEEMNGCFNDQFDELWELAWRRANLG